MSHSYFHTFNTDAPQPAQHPEQRSRLDRLGWDQPHPLTESLLRSKLQPDSEQPRHRVPNPLAPGPNDTLMPFIDHHHKRLP